MEMVRGDTAHLSNNSYRCKQFFEVLAELACVRGAGGTATEDKSAGEVSAANNGDQFLDFGVALREASRRAVPQCVVDIQRSHCSDEASSSIGTQEGHLARPHEIDWVEADATLVRKLFLQFAEGGSAQCDIRELQF